MINSQQELNIDEPVMQFTNQLLQHAIQKSASDIHIEPYENTCRIRYRRDGILHQVVDIPPHLSQRLPVRLKVLADLNISERRLPQDGRFQFHCANKTIDIRISICPTLHGEKIVLRLQDTQKISMPIEQLGFNEAQIKTFIHTIEQPQGLILVTGPTGSGKTVTLYSALQYLNTLEKNISTVEDPIEFQIQGINQVNVNSKIGLGFAEVLRTFLRQDPDIIMIGEIRDTETATIATQAAQTGHLVLSTIHTNSTIATLLRLQAMKIPAYYLTHSLSLIIAQRLIRILCIQCKQLGTNNTYRAVGCKHCLQGYSGRTAIYEFLPVNDEIMQLLLTNATEKITNIATLYQAGLEKVSQGITSTDEINRVVHHESN